MYQEFKEWEYFQLPIEIRNLQFVEGLYNLRNDCIIKIWRDEDYLLKATIGGMKREAESLEIKKEKVPGNFIKPETIVGYSLDGMFKFQINQCVIGTIRTIVNLRGDAETAFDADLHFDDFEKILIFNNGESTDLIRYEWFLASQINISFLRVTKRRLSKEYLKARMDIDPVDSFSYLKSGGS